MMLMPANHSSPLIHYLAGKHPGRIGWLVGPSACVGADGCKTKLRHWMPYALDNDAFGAFTKGTPWDEGMWRAALDWAEASGYEPRWAIVPDVVADKNATLANWARFSPVVADYGWPLAFAVQDGMTADDVPSDADVVFVGGSKKWKWQTVEMWAKSFARVHVGRVNSLDKLWYCQDRGVESVDGTGWFRDESDNSKMPALIKWLNGERSIQTMEMQLT